MMPQVKKPIISLATKYRPKSFSDVCAQTEVVDILQNQLSTDTLCRTLLFTGAAGTGKTTCARIVAKDVNKGLGNPIEIDAASNSGVDNVRDIIAKSQQQSIDTNYKVYILDECHAFSNQAWQAFLKTIEEPPAKTIFIFCTTDPQKIPATIISRVQRYNFQRIPFESVVERLIYIIEQENKLNANIEYEKEAVEFIAKLADGGMRDAITSLDKCVSMEKPLTLTNVVAALGSVDYSTMFDMFNCIVDCEEKELITIVETQYQQGIDLKLLVKQFMLFILDLCKYYATKSFKYIQIPSIYKKDLDSLFEGKHAIQIDFVKDVLADITKLNTDVKYEHNIKSLVELTFMLLCREE